MNTPIADFVRNYARSGTARLHMPGHKGKLFSGCENLDITEINGADALFDADGIIGESEKNASVLFNTAKTLYSAEGSTLCIKTMLALVRRSGEDNVILASRNSHKSLVYGCAQLDIDIDWLFDECEGFSLCRCMITPETLEKKLAEYKKLPCAVYVTSPDYLGGQLDIAALAKVAHKYGMPLLVDNAHGAYLHFLGEKCHPMDLGADMCCDSAHKTLPVLTGGAYLHINNNANEDFCKNAKRKMEMFASTSPSYLILQSLDLCNAYLSDSYNNKLESCIKKVNELKEYLISVGWNIAESDPLKITVASSGINLSVHLRKHGIECEYEDPDYTVMMFTPENNDGDFALIRDAMTCCHMDIRKKDFILTVPEKVMSVKDAIFSDCEKVSIDLAVDRICASPTVGCPPAVPVVTAGERITAQAVEIMKYYSIKYCYVQKKR